MSPQTLGALLIAVAVLPVLVAAVAIAVDALRHASRVIDDTPVRHVPRETWACCGREECACGTCLARRERPVSTPATRAREEAAHQRALTRLAEQHSDQYRALYREELDRA